jgi:hypothetical protein
MQFSAFFAQNAKKRHPLRECPLNVVSICGLCVDNHSMEDCPSFPDLQVVFKQKNETVNPRKENHGNLECRSHKSLRHNNTYLTILTPHSGTLKCLGNHGKYKISKLHLGNKDRKVITMGICLLSNFQCILNIHNSILKIW